MFRLKTTGYNVFTLEYCIKYPGDDTCELLWSVENLNTDQVKSLKISRGKLYFGQEETCDGVNH